jgi:hypothetical protein
VSFVLASQESAPAKFVTPWLCEHKRQGAQRCEGGRPTRKICTDHHRRTLQLCVRSPTPGLARRIITWTTLCVSGRPCVSRSRTEDCARLSHWRRWLRGTDPHRAKTVGVVPQREIGKNPGHCRRPTGATHDTDSRQGSPPSTRPLPVRPCWAQRVRGVPSGRTPVDRREVSDLREGSDDAGGRQSALKWDSSGTTQGQRGLATPVIRT